MREVDGSMTVGSSALDLGSEVLTSAPMLRGIAYLGSGAAHLSGALAEHVTGNDSLQETGGLEPPYGTLTAVDALAEVTLIESTDSIHPPTPPSTTLNIDHVKELLKGEPTDDFEDRVTGLLLYAWRSTSIIERTIPPELIPYVAENPADWYIAKDDEGHQVNFENIRALLEDRSHLMDIYSRSEPYETTSPFLRNAMRIHEIADHRSMREEGLHIELAARLILLEAQARKNTSAVGD